MVRAPYAFLLSTLMATILVHGACNTNHTGTLSFSSISGSHLLILSDADGAGTNVTYNPNIDCTWDHECPAGLYAAVFVVGQLAGSAFVSLMYANNTIVQTMTGSIGFFPSAAISSLKVADPTTLVFPTSNARLRFFSGGATSGSSIGFNATFTCRRSQCSLYNESSPLIISQLPWTVDSDSDGEGAVPSSAGETCEWRLNLPSPLTLSVSVTFGSLAPGDIVGFYNGSSSVPLIRFQSSSLWSIPVSAKNPSMMIRYSTSRGLANRNGFRLTVRLCRVFNITNQVELSASQFMIFSAFQAAANVPVSGGYLLFSDCLLSSLVVVARCQSNPLLLSCGISLQRSNLTGTLRVTASNNATVSILDSTLRGSIFNLNLVSKSLVHFERCLIHSTDTYHSPARVNLAMQSALVIMSSTVFGPIGASWPASLWAFSNYATRSLVLILNSTVICPGAGCEIWDSCSSDLGSRVVIMNSIVQSGGEVTWYSGNVPNVIRSLRTCYTERIPAPSAVTLDSLFSPTCSPATPLSSSWTNKAACLLEEFCDPRFTSQVVGNRSNQSCRCICDSGTEDCQLPAAFALTQLRPLASSTRTHSLAHTASRSPSAFSGTATSTLHWSLSTASLTDTGRDLRDSLGASATFTASITFNSESPSATPTKSDVVWRWDECLGTTTRTLSYHQKQNSTLDGTRRRATSTPALAKRLSSAASVSSTVTGLLSPQAAIQGTRLGLMGALLRCAFQQEPGTPEVGQFVFPFGILPDGERAKVEPENQFAGGCLSSASLILLFTFSAELVYRVQRIYPFLPQAKKAIRLCSLLELTAAVYFLPNMFQGLVLVARRSGDVSLLFVTAGSALVGVLPLVLSVYRIVVAFDSHLYAELNPDEVSSTLKWEFHPCGADNVAGGGKVPVELSELFLARTAPMYDTLRLPAHRLFRLSICVDVLFSILIGCAAGWYPSATDCSGLALFVVCVCVASTIWSVAVRPPWGKIDRLFHVMTNVLLLGDSGIGFAMVYLNQDVSSSSSTPIADAKEIISLLASSCFLVQLVVTLFWQVALWHRRRIRGLERVRRTIGTREESTGEMGLLAHSAPLIAEDASEPERVVLRPNGEGYNSGSQRPVETIFNPLGTPISHG